MHFMTTNWSSKFLHLNTDKYILIDSPYIIIFTHFPQREKKKEYHAYALPSYLILFICKAINAYIKLNTEYAKHQT